MSSLAFLVTELQSLASETRRKHPEIREAAEKSLAILRASPEQATANLASEGPQSDDLLRPVFMGCATRNAKVVAISLGSLQRLIALKAVPQSAVPLIIKTMTDAVTQGVDIQLRILQTLLSLITNFPAVHGELLGDALLLCFRLQESKIAVVSSTAAATLRQLVMFVVDKVVDEDRHAETVDADIQLVDVTLPDGTTKSLGPSARDAFSVFEDLCLLANSEKPHFLKLEFLHKTFALELIESVLTNYHDLFRSHSELVLLLRHHLCPLLLKALADRPIFPLTLRCTRVVFLLLKQFSPELETEAEVFLVFLIRTISDDSDTPGDRPQWMRVLAMEIMRGLCSDSELIRNVWLRYDAREPNPGVFTSLISALKRLLTEKPALLGVGVQMGGEGSSSSSSHVGLGYGLDMAGRVATAASATVSGVVGMMGTSAGLSLQGSAMKLQCIDQLDKADSPPIPEAYIYLLGVQSLVALCDGFASYAGPLYNTLVIQKPRVAGETAVRAPPALDFETLDPEELSTKHLIAVRDMIASGWPALLAALSFIISTNLADELFVDVLASYQSMTNVAGMLGLVTPRDAFFTSLSKLAIPTRVVSSLDSASGSSNDPPMTPRSSTSTAFELGLSIAGAGSSSQPVTSLSERNLACLKVLISSAMFLAGSLGESWFGILEALQNADYVLTSKGVISTNSPAVKRNISTAHPSSPAGRVVALGSQGQGAGGTSSVTQSPPLSSTNPVRHPLLMDLDTDTMHQMIQRLFDGSKNLEDAAFSDFVRALCRLSAEMIGMQTTTETLVENGSTSLEDVTLSPPRSESSSRRRVSGIHIPRTLRSGDFGINRLGGVAMLNMHRLIYRAPEIAWDSTTSHLLSIIRLPYAPQPIRVQAARVLDDILVVVPRNLTTAGELQAKVQRQVLDVLSQQVVPDGTEAKASTSTSVELRRMGLETLHQILQASGHTLVVGWETIFEMLASVTKPQVPLGSSSESLHELSSTAPSGRINRPIPLGLGNPSEKSYTALVKIAFQSLTLVCDSVSSLSPEHLRLCISTLGQFGRQSDTNIALTAAESLLWSVSDAIQSKRSNAEDDSEYSDLWMFLLLEVLGLCSDTRLEVRVGAIQTLFRTMQLYGATLSLETWEQCIWKVTFPLLESITSEIRRHASIVYPTPVAPPGAEYSSTVSPSQGWNESKTLALQSIGSIFHEFLATKIMHLTSFEKAWDVFVNHVQEAVLLDDRSITSPALRCLEKSLKASSVASSGDLKERVADMWERVWKSSDEMGEAVVKRTRTPVKFSADIEASENPYKPFTQESLVAFVDLIQCARNISRVLGQVEWPLEKLTRLMAILKGILTYPSSPDYRPDIDNLPPVQAVVLDAIAAIDLSASGVPSLVIQDLSEFATLPFLAAFDVPAVTATNTPPKRITYIALTKKTMPLLVDLFMKFKDRTEIYVDGTLEAVLSAYSIPVKLKYDCPPPSKFGKDLPLWKTATTCFLRIVKECAVQLGLLGADISDERIEGIWRQVLDVFKGGILADCSAVESFPLHVQEAEENFDLSLIAALEIDVVPHFGDARLPDSLVSQLSKVLHQGSRLYEVDGPDSREEKHSAVDNADYGLGSTDSGVLVPRERFSYWCFDLLFLICSNTTKDQEHRRRRLAALSISTLLTRCRAVMVGYVADEALRGNLPFPRAREDELLYVLRKLLATRLWPGSLWAALSDSPSEYSVIQPPTDTALPPSQVIADAVKRSSVGHLFHFYAVLCDIAAIPRKSPSSWILAEAPSPSASSSDGSASSNAVELDARDLARQCLKEIGREMGVDR